MVMFTLRAIKNSIWRTENDVAYFRKSSTCHTDTLKKRLEILKKGAKMLDRVRVRASVYIFILYFQKTINAIRGFGCQNFSYLHMVQYHTVGKNKEQPYRLTYQK